jgi:hypothetical protein
MKERERAVLAVFYYLKMVYADLAQPLTSLAHPTNKYAGRIRSGSYFFF